MIFTTMLNAIGETPFVKWEAAGGNKNIYIKLEGYNPTGSVKDRACHHIINTMIAQQRLKPGMTLLDASSGNFASALAYIGKIMDIPTEVVVSSKVTAEKKDFIRFFGARVTQVGHFTIDGNRYCRELAEKDKEKKYLFVDQLHNCANPEAYFTHLAPEIHRQFPNLIAVIGSLGSGGTMLGTGKYFKLHKPEVKIITAEATNGSSIPGVGSFDGGDYVTPFIKEGREEGIFDKMYKVDEAMAKRRTSELAGKGIFCGMQTGGVLDVAMRYIAEEQREGDIIVISGDSGWKNLSKLML